MNVFLLDLLHDLRAKRLVPVAIALVVALVAVPVVLLKGGGEEPSSEAPVAGAAAASRPGTVPAVQAVEQGPGGSSDLGVFDPKDPFKSALGARKRSTADGTAQLVTPSAGAGGSSSSAAPSSGGSNGASSGPPATGEGIDLNGPSKSPSTGNTPTAIRPVRKNYTYVLDVKFGQTGNERTRKGVKRLDILPNDRDPVVVFLGVASDVKRAVFLIDSRISQSGEGACRPSVKSCTFLYLRDEKDRNEQFLTDEQGREYHLTLLDIRKVEVKRSSSKRAKSARRRVGPRGRGARVMRFPAFAPDVQR